MRYRKLTADGDYTFGQNSQNFYYDIDAVGQAIKTRLQLYKGSFWRDLEAGLPLYQSIIDTSGSSANLQTVDNIIKQEILGTEGVTDMPSFESSFDPETRAYSFRAEVNTVYSTIVLEETL